MLNISKMAQLEAGAQLCGPESWMLTQSVAEGNIQTHLTT